MFAAIVITLVKVTLKRPEALRSVTVAFAPPPSTF